MLRKWPLAYILYTYQVSCKLDDISMWIFESSKMAITFVEGCMLYSSHSYTCFLASTLVGQNYIHGGAMRWRWSPVDTYLTSVSINRQNRLHVEMKETCLVKESFRCHGTAKAKIPCKIPCLFKFNESFCASVFILCTCTIWAHQI